MEPVERFEAMLAQGKDNALLRFTLGSHYLQQGNAAVAARHLQAAVAHDTGYSAAWKLLGKSLAALDRSDEAILAYRAGIAAAGKHGDKQAAKEMQVFLRRLEKVGGAGD